MVRWAERGGPSKVSKPQETGVPGEGWECRGNSWKVCTGHVFPGFPQKCRAFLCWGRPGVTQL